MRRPMAKRYETLKNGAPGQCIIIAREPSGRERQVRPPEEREQAKFDAAELNSFSAPKNLGIRYHIRCLPLLRPGPGV